jgi:hypothetical protein
VRKAQHQHQVCDNRQSKVTIKAKCQTYSHPALQSPIAATLHMTPLPRMHPAAGRVRTIPRLPSPTHHPLKMCQLPPCPCSWLQPCYVLKARSMTNLAQATTQSRVIRNFRHTARHALHGNAIPHVPTTISCMHTSSYAPETGQTSMPYHILAIAALFTTAGLLPHDFVMTLCLLGASAAALA